MIAVRSSMLRALAAAALMVMAACAGPPAHRYFRPTSDEVDAGPNTYGQAVVPRHGLIVVQGDDLAYGRAIGRSRKVINDAPSGQASVTISETLRRAIH